MSVIFKLCRDGSFVAGDTATGHTSYAYPTTPNATQAKRRPAKVAAEMIERANAYARHCTASIVAEYDARNFVRLNDE